MVKIAIFIAVVILIPCYSVAGWFGPSTYEECLLKNLKGVSSDRAASFISRACREKFPIQLPTQVAGPLGLFDDTQSTVLSWEEVSRLSISTLDYDSESNSYHCRIYNRTNLKLTQIEVSAPGKNGTKTYYFSFIIPPQTIGTKWLKVEPGTSDCDSWRIVGAKGYSIK